MITELTDLEKTSFLAAFREAAPKAADATAVSVGRRVEAVGASAYTAVPAGVRHGVDRDGAGVNGHVGPGAQFNTL